MPHGTYLDVTADFFELEVVYYALCQTGGVSLVAFV